MFPASTLAHTSQRSHSASHAARHDAVAPVERRLLEQFFNTYCRETGVTDPRVPLHAPVPEALHDTIANWRGQGLQPALLALGGARGQRRWLAAALAYFSDIGYHQVAYAALLDEGASVPVSLYCAEPLVDAIVDALSHAHGVSPQAEWPARFSALIKNGADKVRFYHDHPLRRAAPSVFVEAEQGLRFGHIFHVTSKASEGFDNDDLQRYAPELGAAFRLHYFAVFSELFDSITHDGKPLPIDPAAMAFAADLLCEGAYRLLPCHPWQANYLLQQDAVKQMLARHALISLGPLGELVWPTSSVRTVWLPQRRLFLKLALDVRITNFVRNNPPEHVRRALDASQAIQLLPESARATPSFTVLTEFGSATLAVDDAALRASTAVIYRQGMRGGDGDHAQVLASVLEEPVQGDGALARLLREALGPNPRPEQVRQWWSRYLDVTLLPLGELFANHGISLEAHLQNSMVAFRDGWPVHGYVRDMEGASISRARYGWLDQLPADSPALYEDAAAWHRFCYYVLVNHIGHFIACLARTGWCDEATLWQDTGGALRERGSDGLRVLADTLARQPVLPAKANMLSCFGRHGEMPAWVDIPNPLFTALSATQG